MSTQPTYVPLPKGYLLAYLEPGDRYERAGTLVEVIEGPRQEQVRVRSVGTGRVHARPADAKRHRVDTVQLLADRPRHDRLNMLVWAGGSNIFTTRPTALDVNLTRDGQVWLRPTFHPAGTAGTFDAAGNPRTRSYFDRMHVVVPAAKSNGILALLSPGPRNAPGMQEWDALALRMRMLRDLCGGLTPAGQTLLDIGEHRTPVDDFGAWTAAVSANMANDLTCEQGQVLASLASTWTGTAAELISSVRDALTQGSA